MTPQELKASILELAIHGKLVPQIPEEGTGEDLYEQIKMANAQESTGKRKGKSKNTILPITEEDIPFEIPETWKWVRLGTIGYTNIGLTYSPKDITDDGIIVLRSSNIQNDSMDYEDIVRVKMDIPENKMCHIGDILICARNGSKRLVGKAAIIDKEGMSFGAFMAIFRSPCNEYVLQFINSAYFRNSLLGDTGTTTINQITQDMLKNALIPLPPFAEQKRIVAKIEELLPYIDRYEQAWSRLEDFNKRFPVDMQKSILQIAIQGKLVPQYPEEGTGEELYQQIQKEKQALIKVGKIKKEKLLPEIAEDEIPFDIPENWKWVRLGSIIDMLSGFAFKSTDFRQAGKYRLLRGINLSVGSTRWDDTVYVEDIPEKLNIYQIQKGDVLIGLDRPWISDGIRVAIFDDEIETYLVQRVLRIRKSSAITKEYIALLLRSNLFRNSVEGETTGISVPHISPKQVGSVAIPLPPLAEQKRIVAKLEEILPLCERLK